MLRARRGGSSHGEDPRSSFHARDGCGRRPGFGGRAYGECTCSGAGARGVQPGRLRYLRYLRSSQIAALLALADLLPNQIVYCVRPSAMHVGLPAALHVLPRSLPRLQQRRLRVCARARVRRGVQPRSLVPALPENARRPSGTPDTSPTGMRKAGVRTQVVPGLSQVDGRQRPIARFRQFGSPLRQRGRTDSVAGAAGFLAL
jgi:hypothetical protein